MDSILHGRASFDILETVMTCDKEENVTDPSYKN